MELIISGAIGIATAIVGYLVGKKKQDAETDLAEAQAHSSELDATEKAVAIWRNLAEDLKKEVDELRFLINELRRENAKLKDEIEHLQIKLSKIVQE